MNHSPSCLKHTSRIPSWSVLTLLTQQLQLKISINSCVIKDKVIKITYSWQFLRLNPDSEQRDYYWSSSVDHMRFWKSTISELHRRFSTSFHQCSKNLKKGQLVLWVKLLPCWCVNKFNSLHSIWLHDPTRNNIWVQIWK